MEKYSERLDRKLKMRKLNLGCGSKKLDGYLNVDITSRVNPDMVVPSLPERLPFEDKEFDEVLFENCFQYIKIIDILPSLDELCRIGKVVLCNFNPKNQMGSTIWTEGIKHSGFAISDMRGLSNNWVKRDNNWKWRPYDYNITKIWFELKFANRLPVRLFQNFINKTFQRQRIYENSFLFYLLQPEWIWVRIENETTKRNVHIR